MELCKVISSYVHSKITQLKFDKMIDANQAQTNKNEAEMRASESSESDSSSDDGE